MEFSPFREGDTYSTFRAHLERTIAEIHALDNEYVLKASETELQDHYISNVSIEPISLDESNFYIEDQKGTKIDVSHDFDRGGFGREHIEVPGTELSIAIPFDGDPGLFRLRPSTYSMSGYSLPASNELGLIMYAFRVMPLSTGISMSSIVARSKALRRSLRARFSSSSLTSSPSARLKVTIGGSVKFE